MLKDLVIWTKVIIWHQNYHRCCYQGITLFLFNLSFTRVLHTKFRDFDMFSYSNKILPKHVFKWL